LASGTDIVSVELEDGIALKDKDKARKQTLALFAEPQADNRVERVVPINCVRKAFGMAEVQAVLATNTPPPVLMMVKVRTPDEAVWLDGLSTEQGYET
jgi:(S)-citramalyl-CoA lyase